MRIHRAAALVLLSVLGCAPPPAPAPPPPLPELPPRAFAYGVVWTARAAVELRSDSTLVVVDPVLTRLDVASADSATARVRCSPCGDPRTLEVRLGDVVYEPLPPRVAARGTLAEFALALRAAAARMDTTALRPVMAPEFTFSFVGEQGVDAAFAAWGAGGLAELAALPPLLDRGITAADSVLWAAPPEHFRTLGYTGPRAGFRRDPAGAWEWTFFVKGVLER